MDRAINSLLLKANRALSSRLSDLNLVDLDHLDDANEHFIEHLREGDLVKSSILRVLLYELQCIDETHLLDHQLSELRLGALPLAQYQIPDALTAGFSLEECIATWTIPVDLMGDVYCVATAYYLSTFVREFWETKLDSRVIWYVASVESLETVFEREMQKRMNSNEENA